MDTIDLVNLLPTVTGPKDKKFSRSLEKIEAKPI